jgi:hypothetical protein
VWRCEWMPFPGSWLLARVVVLVVLYVVWGV